MIAGIKATQYFKLVWDELDGLKDPTLSVGRSAEMVERYCSKGGPVEEKLTPCKEHITKASTAELSV
ncbi:hypothetical protein NKR23_g5414 [Pleurostoma richardsiae]|uniref:Uncharacterized protein n=1 Tax=Pleurostoma richardsiae TaxID=41990 RepID=A0AA38RDR4_9PEZI|nr:hypothetical protein NKR23_g5414 [Pleurostoma richardsiae]